RRRRVEVDAAQRRSSGCLDLVSLAARDEDQAAGDELVAMALDNGVTATGDNEQPLIRAAMAIARIAFRISGRDHHLGSLRSPIAPNHAKRFFETQSLEFHS